MTPKRSRRLATYLLTIVGNVLSDFYERVDHAFYRLQQRVDDLRDSLDDERCEACGVPLVGYGKCSECEARERGVRYATFRSWGPIAKGAPVYAGRGGESGEYVYSEADDRKGRQLGVVTNSETGPDGSSRVTVEVRTSELPADLREQFDELCGRRGGKTYSMGYVVKEALAKAALDDTAVLTTFGMPQQRAEVYDEVIASDPVLRDAIEARVKEVTENPNTNLDRHCPVCKSEPEMPCVYVKNGVERGYSHVERAYGKAESL